jgi:hypothetical protein
MAYQVWQGSKIMVGEYSTEIDAIAALVEHCRVEGVPVADAAGAMSKDLWQTDRRGRRTRRWWGEQLAAKCFSRCLSSDRHHMPARP